MPSLPSEYVIRRAEDADKLALSLILAAAFDQDPVARFCVRADARRKWAMRTGFKKALDLYFPHNLTFVINNETGVALWARHDQWRFSFWQECALLPLYVRICGINRFMRLSRGFNVMKSYHPAEPHYYLYLLGVHPAHQSQGLGSALLRPMLERCDREQMPAYLEATHPRNISFYQRHGFHVMKEFLFGSGGPLLSAMWRKPR